MLQKLTIFSVSLLKHKTLPVILQQISMKSHFLITLLALVVDSLLIFDALHWHFRTWFKILVPNIFDLATPFDNIT